VRVVLVILGSICCSLSSTWFDRSSLLIPKIVFRDYVADVVPFADLQKVCAADMVPGSQDDELKQGLASERMNSLCVSRLSLTSGTLLFRVYRAAFLHLEHLYP
jgi:hypothetical protein